MQPKNIERIQLLLDELNIAKRKIVPFKSYRDRTLVFCIHTDSKKLLLKANKNVFDRTILTKLRLARFNPVKRESYVHRYFTENPLKTTHIPVISIVSKDSLNQF